MPQIIILVTKNRDRAIYMLGQLPSWLHDDDPRSAAEQINLGYRFGGWRPMKGPTLGKGNAMCYPGDPPQLPFAEIVLRNERIFAYPHEFWGILSPDGKFEVARLD